MDAAGKKRIESVPSEVFTQLVLVSPLAPALMPAAATHGRLAGLSLGQVRTRESIV